MDRIQRIIDHEQATDIPEAEVNVHKWKAARLIWEELQSKTVRDLGAEIKERGVKRGYSITHLTWMKKCWQVVVVDRGLVFGSVSDLPPFNQIYNSDEVRGTGKEEKQGPKRERQERPERGERKERPAKEGSDFSPSGLVATAERAVSLLATNRAYWQLLSAEDRNLLSRVAGLCADILGDSDH
jgi:hypothetical protein